ncbi:MAG: saccharopine dehydrogenase NADP-binding domain-containing protein [Flavobacteriaceae bacterium]|nr:saccharopine dehydrogenase NADP-binding domain-containing protein [Flavobacteriaceae bacterium]
MSTKRQILIIGAGRSASSLIQYLLDKSDAENLHLVVADLTLALAESKTNDHPNATALALDINQVENRRAAVQHADIVISMLPASMHLGVAQDCIDFGKHLITASYVSNDMLAMDAQVKAKGLIFMNEIGLDPGIDHMSAMQIIDRIKANGGKMILFESFTGGLVAPESDDNLWHYKFTWNPRNVVVAGQGGAAKFIQEGRYKYIPYQKLFRRTEILHIDGYGKFEGLANRDSLKYREIYGLDDIHTMYRGTIRRVGYSKAWNVFVQLGMTDDTYLMENTQNMSYREFINSFLPYHPYDSVELKLRQYLQIDQDDVLWEKLEELELFNPSKKVNMSKATPAQILEKILTEKWTLKPEDKDMIVMLHKFGFELNGVKKQIESSMVVIGRDQVYTAMSDTVGLPVAMATLKILNKQITKPGVQIPINQEVYEPILEELKEYGVVFTEKEVPYLGYNQERILGY